MELEMRFKYWLTKKGLYNKIVAFNMAVRKEYNYKRARNLLLHMNFKKMGCTLNPKIPFKQHDEMINAVAIMFEGKEYINDVGRNAVLNLLCYVEHATAKDIILAYFRTTVTLSDSEILTTINDMSDEFYNLLIYAIVGKRTTVSFGNKVLEDELSNNIPLTKGIIETVLSSSAFNDYSFVRIPSGMYLIKD